MSTLSIDISRATRADAADIAAVHDAAWRYTYRGILSGIDLERMIERRGPLWWDKAISRNVVVLVVKVERQVVGYATLGPSRMRALPYGGEIYEIYLKPEFHGLGLGRRLFEAARAMLADLGFEGLAVRALKSNDIAVAFYQAIGGLPIIESGERIGDSLLPVVIFGWPALQSRTTSPKG